MASSNFSLTSSSNWLYEKRDTVSYSSVITITLLVAILWLMPHTPKKPVTAATEMIAMLENMPLPKVEKQIEKKVEEKKVEKKVEKVQNNIVEKTNVTPPVETNDPNAEKVAPAQVTKSENVASNPKIASAAEPTSGPSISARYEAILRAYLEKIKRYPTSREARLARPEGVVKVWLELTRTGELVAVGILESSGFNLLDSETIKTLKSGTFPSFPDGAFVGEATHKFIANMKYTIANN